MNKLFFIFLFSIPFVHATECSSLLTPDICEQLSSSNLTVEEQEYLTSALINDNHQLPSHDFVRQWNLNINTEQPPYGTALHEIGFIKSAWVKILTIMPI